MVRTRGLVAMVVVTLLAVAPAAWGQWSSDPAVNLAIADLSDAQVQPKLAPTGDGGFYVSWFDNSAGGYDVYLQRLDADGVELWAHNGILVADRSYSSTQDYGLSIDTAGNALLAFNDDRGGTESVTVALVSPAGIMPWGSAGVQVASSATAFFGPPAVTGTSDGDIVVAWSQDNDMVAQKLDPSGAPLWGAGVLFHPTTGSYFVSDLHASEAGTAILSFVTFSARTLLAQKLGSDGSLLWAAEHVPVFDGGTLQYGNFPPFVTDGAGGAVFAWYSSSPALQCRVQRVLANGSEAFAHNGVEVATTASRVRVSPSAAFLPDTGETYVFWTEADEYQTVWGVYGQKLDASGARQWTDGGRQVVPLGANQTANITTLACASDALVAWSENLSYNNDRLHVARLDSAGGFVWPSSTIDIATAAIGHSRLDGSFSPAGFAAYVWERGDYSNADVVAQNLYPAGDLGLPLFADGFESGDTDAWSYATP